MVLRSWRVGVGLTIGALAAGFLGLWVERGRIAASMARDYLRSQGVAARVVIDEIGLDGVVGRVEAGAPADPDLVIDHLDVRFGARAGEVKSISLTGLTLRGRYDGARVTFGTLQPYLDKLLAGKGPTPSLDVTVTRGRLTLLVPGGRTIVDFSGRVRESRLQDGIAVVRPFGFAAKGVDAAVGGGKISVATEGEASRIVGELALPRVQAGGVTLLGGRLSFDAHSSILRRPDWLGPQSVSTRLDADSIASGRGLAKGVRIRGAFKGVGKGDLSSPEFAGAIDSSATVQQVLAGGVLANDITASLGAANATLGVRSGSLSAAAAPKARLAAARAVVSGAVITDVTAALDGSANYDAGGPRANGHAALNGRLSLAAAPPRLREVRVSAADLGVALAGSMIDVEAKAPIYVAAPGGTARVSRVAGAPLYRSGVGLGRGGVLVDLAGPDAPSAHLTANYHLAAQGLAAGWTLQAGWSHGDLHDLKADLAGDLVQTASAIQLTLSRCGVVSLREAGSGAAASLADASARLCPISATIPAVSEIAGRWVARARLLDGAGRSPMAQMTLGGVRADLEATGASALEASASFVGVHLRDDAKPGRFGDLSVSGTAGMRDGRVQAHLIVAKTRDPAAKASIDVTHRLDSGVGEATIAAPAIRFAVPGLQPSDLSPILKAYANRVSGGAAFDGRLGWTPQAMTSAGRLDLNHLDFNSAYGKVHDLNGHLDLTSLAPPVSAPNQAFTVASIDAATPLTDLSASFQLTGSSLKLGGLRAHVSKGVVSLDPMIIGFAQDAQARGVLRLANIDLGEIIAKSSLAENVTMNARVSGATPFVFGASGLRLAEGKLAADGPGRLEINRKALQGAGVVEAPNMAQYFAYQAMEHLAFDEMTAALDSRAGGRLGVVFHIRGRSDPAIDAKATLGLFTLAQGRIPDKPIPLPKGTEVNLTLDTSINFDDLVNAYLAAGQPSRSSTVQP